MDYIRCNTRYPMTNKLACPHSNRNRQPGTHSNIPENRVAWPRTTLLRNVHKQTLSPRLLRSELNLDQQPVAIQWVYETSDALIDVTGLCHDSMWPFVCSMLKLLHSEIQNRKSCSKIPLSEIIRTQLCTSMPKNNSQWLATKKHGQHKKSVFDFSKHKKVRI